MKISVVLMAAIIILYVITRPVKRIRILNKKIDNQMLFLSSSCILLFFVAAFRGDFATDYPVYYWQFNSYKIMPITNVWAVRDIGFFLWTKFVFLFTDNTLFCFVSMAFVMMMAYYYLIKNNSRIFLLSLLMLVGIDNYVVSFNLMRYILVVAIYMNLVKYIESNELWKYIKGVVLLTLLHRSAIVMIPFYWILTIDYRKRKNILALCAGVLFFVLMFFFTKKIAVLIQSIIGMNYGDSGLDYGNIGSALKSIWLIMIMFLFVKKINYSEKKERIWVNGCILATLFHVLATKVLIMHRAAYMLSGFFFLLMPLIISRLSKKQGVVVLLCIILIMFVYCQFIQNIQEYYPFWENKIIKYW